MSAPSYEQTRVGDALPALTVQITRADLVRYAGASGDFNIIHWNERVARDVGLPDVIAHGMLTMGSALRVVTEWVGDPARVRSYFVRFTKPVVVPDDAEGTELVFGGVVEAVDDALLVEDAVGQRQRASQGGVRSGIDHGCQCVNGCQSALMPALRSSWM